MLALNAHVPVSLDQSCVANGATDEPNLLETTKVTSWWIIY